MLCDLRGFTELSNRLPGKRVLDLPAAYFDQVVPAIVDAGGEVIQFMGDGVLAFFHRAQPTASGSAALRGALLAPERLPRFTTTDVDLRPGVALHFRGVQ